MLQPRLIEPHGDFDRRLKGSVLWCPTRSSRDILRFSGLEGSCTLKSLASGIAGPRI